jgi:amino acid transporter
LVSTPRHVQSTIDLSAVGESKKRGLGTIGLAFALYSMVAGGPYGLEELIEGAGTKLALVVLLVTPVVWSLPTALLVGELGAALPEEGGFYAWVRRGLGPFWGFEEAWLSLVASVFDMAIYPALFTAYVARLWPAAGEPHLRLLLAVGVVAVAAAMNLRGARSVGSASVVLGLAVIAPFVVLTALLVWRGNADGFVPPVDVAGGGETAEHIGLVGALLVSMWNAMGWDNASTIAAEVERPERAYPRGVALALLLVTVTYLVPVGAMAWAHVPTGSFSTGAWVDLGRAVGGPALAVAIVVGGMVCGYGMQSALSLSYSRIPLALAEDGFLPPIFGRTAASTGAPVMAIVACALAWTLSLGLDFQRLVALDILLYGSSLALEFVALVALRRREPGLPRPVRVPGGMTGAVLLGVLPMALLAIAAVRNAHETLLGVNALGFGAGLAALGVPMYFLTKDRWPRVVRGAVPRPAVAGEPR